MHAWDAGQYLRFADQRTLPARDLVARIDLAQPRRIVDLGCGPGNSTAVLRERWLDAAVTGIDTSAELLAAARLEHPGIDFVVGDIAGWAPDEPYDLVFSNAALQWVGDHERLLPRLMEAVAPGGALAVQMPRNHDFATHVLMRQVAAEGPWGDRLAGARDPSPVRPPEFYYDCLAPKSRSVILWETNYIQVMDGGRGNHRLAARHRAASVSRPARRSGAASLSRPLRRAARRGVSSPCRRQSAAALSAPLLRRHTEMMNLTALVALSADQSTITCEVTNTDLQGKATSGKAVYVRD
jgi:trans-aconitate 2-methyltransferase